MIILHTLGPEAGALFGYPTMLQAVEMNEDSAVGQLLISAEAIPMTIDQREVDAFDTEEDGESVAFQLYTRSDGLLVLERKKEERKPIPQPPPLQILADPRFENAPKTPTKKYPALPPLPTTLLSPQFTEPLYTPPQTPQFLPFSPGGFISPTFERAPNTPVEEYAFYN